jgi:cell division septation protein DedD
MMFGNKHIAQLQHRSFLSLSSTIFSLCLLLTFSSQLTHTQSSDAEIKSAIDKVNHGQADNVRKTLPDLVAKYQNTPGFLYLEGRLASDGIEAVKFYQGVVDNFPKSEWADDALFRIYQYYYALGLYRTADLKMQQLKKDFPTSPFVTGKPQAALPKQDEEAVNLPVKDTVVAETPKPITPPISQPQSAPVQTPPSMPAQLGAYTLQVGAFSTVANAEKQKDFFEDLGYAAEITNKVRGGKSLHLVWVGSFKTADEAMRFGKEVKTKHKISSIVVERY